MSELIRLIPREDGSYEFRVDKEVSQTEQIKEILERNVSLHSESIASLVKTVLDVSSNKKVSDDLKEDTIQKATNVLLTQVAAMSANVVFELKNL